MTMQETETDYPKMVADKAADFQPLFDRYDGDKALYFMDAFKMMNPDGTTEMTDVINVTFNDPNTYALRSIATLAGCMRQTVIKSRSLSEKQCTTIENFIEDISYDIDDGLVNREILCLDAFLNEQICVRGSIAAESLCRKEEGKFIIDVVPKDVRFFVYDRGMKGLKWAAPIYFRSKSSIKEEYKKDIVEDEAEIVDLYLPAKNIIYTEQDNLKNQKTPYDYVPFVIAHSASGSMLQDKDAFPHIGESIFWSNRAMFPELNRTASILQTLNVGSFAGGMQYESELGIAATKPSRPPFGVRIVVPVEKGGGYKALPVNDIRNATRLFYAILYTRIQQGGLSAIDYGNLTFPLSAVAIARVTSGRDQIFLPRLQAKAIFYQQLFKMVIKQFIQVGVGVEIGEEGAKRKYKPGDLEGEYTIQFRFLSESKEQRIANLSEAQAARGTLSEFSIRRDILKVQDPEAEDERVAAEQAEKNDEALFLYNRCSSFIAQGKNVQAWLLYYRLRNVLRARGGVVNEAAAKTLKSPGGRQMIPLLGAGGGGGGGINPTVGSEAEELAKAEAHGERVAEEGSEAKQEQVR